MDRRTDILERFSVTRAIVVYVTAVDNAAIGQDIGKTLTNVAKAMGFPVMRTDFSSEYSARTAQQLNISYVLYPP
jgi:hypothetical protein